MIRPSLRAAVIAVALVPIVLGTALAVHARAAAPNPDRPPVAAPQPVITIVSDTPHAAALLPATAPRATGAQDAMVPPDQNFLGANFGRPRALPPAGSSCATQPPVHFDGFTSMRGSGQDVVTENGSSTTYPAYATHVDAQYTCTEATPSGGVRVLLHVIPVSADQSTYAFDMGPAGLILQSIAPGVSQTRGDFLTVNRRLGDWVSPSCLGFADADLGPRHAAIDDTFCFAPDGILQHAVLHEKATDVNGVARDLEVTLDLQR